MGDWSNLPGDLLFEIDQLLTYADHVRLCAVCLQWRSLIPKRPKLPVSQIPWLMLPFNNNVGDQGNSSYCSIYSLVDRKVYPLELPEASDMLYCGSSSDGWLVVVGKDPALKLINPLMSKQIDDLLPPASALPNVIEYLPERTGEEYHLMLMTQSSSSYYLDSNHVHHHFIDKVVLSRRHRNNDYYTVVAIYGEFSRLAFCKHGDTQWTDALTEHRGFADALFHEGRFYAIKFNGVIVGSSIDMLPRVFEIEVIKLPKVRASQLYLVGTAEGLLIVKRCYTASGLVHPRLGRSICRYKTTKFKIHKLDMSKPSIGWSKVESLDNDIMFLGLNSPIVVSASNFPGLKGNCIYFTDDYKDCHYEDFLGGYDVGVLNLDDGTTTTLLGYDGGGGDNIFVWPPPTWVIPCSC